MALGYKNFVKGIGVVPKGAADSNALGDIEVLNTDNKLYFHNGTLSDPLVSETVQATLTNKVLTGNEADNLVHSGGGQLDLNSSGTITIPNGTDTLVGLTLSQTLTNKTIDGGNNTLSNIANGSLVNSSITINGNSVSLGGSTTITANTTNALTIGTGLTGTSFNGSAPVTIAIDSTVVTLTGTQTLTNKTLTSPVLNTPTADTIENIAGGALTITGNNEPLNLTTLGATALTIDSSGSLILESGTVLNVTAGQNLNLSAPSGDASLSANAAGGTSVISGANVQLISNTGNIILGANNTIILDTLTNPIELRQTGTTVVTIDGGLKIKPAQSLTLEGSTSNNISISNPDTAGSSYNIALPNSAPAANTALVYNGSNYVWGTVGGNLAVDSFSGDGSTTAFVISQDPGTENNTQVYISGVYQQKDAYSLSGTTLTFGSAPPSGTNNIQVVSGGTLAVGTPSDGTVTNAKLSNVASQTIKGRVSGGSGLVEDLTATQATSILNPVVGDSGSGGTKGLVPAPAAGDAAAGKFLKADGTFAIPPGQGDINFITNSQALVDTSGWATYADVAGSAPVDGTGGSPSITWTRTTTTPLVGTASFLFTKDAANRQGQGSSFDFVIDSAFRAKVLQINFEYAVASGTFAAGSSTADSDVTVWIYDITNNVIIQPSTFRLFASNALSTTFTSNFQTSSNSTNYRLILHCATTSASAFSLEVDDIRVAPSQYVYGTPITDLEVVPSATVTGLTGATTTSPTFGSSSVNRVLRGRIGDHARLRYEYVYTSAGTSGTGDYLFSLPTGLAFDSSKVTYYTTVEGTGDWAQRGSCFGTATADFQGVSSFLGTIVPYDSTRFRVFGHFNAAAVPANSVISSSSFAPIGTSGSWCFDFQAPIAGFSSSVQTSDQADSRVVAARLIGSGPQSNGHNTEIQLTNWTVSYDTHAAWSSSQYTVPVAGVYKFSANATFATNATGARRLYYRIDGGAWVFLDERLGNASIGQYVAGQDGLSLRAGQTIQFGSFQNSGGALNISVNFVTIERLSQASLISATETVAAKYSLSTGPATGVNTIIDYSTRVYDTHSAVTTGASWAFRAPVSGIYRVTNSSCTAAATLHGMRYFVNGSAVEYISATATGSAQVSGASSVRLNAGDTVDFRMDSNVTLIANVQLNYITIERIGL